MKAKDLFEKYHSKLLGDSEPEAKEALSNLFIELCVETEEILCKRKVRTDRALLSLIREQNQKYNSFVRLINKEAGEEVLIEDGFRKIIYEKLGVEGGNKNEKGND